MSEETKKPTDEEKDLLKALLVMRADIGTLEFSAEEGESLENLQKLIKYRAKCADELLSDRKTVQMRYEGLRDLGFVQDVDAGQNPPEEKIVSIEVTEPEFRILIAMWTIAPLGNMGRPKAHTQQVNAWLDRLAQKFGYKDATEADQFSPSVPDSEYP